MIPSIKYPAKILLFGEYSILAGSDALAFPYATFSGNLEYACLQKTQPKSAMDSQKDLIKLFKYLDTKFRDSNLVRNLDLDQFRNDIISGLFFNSNIPRNYGIGSSGALTAAIFSTYFSSSEKASKEEILCILAEIESYFHQKSSGIDPYVSLTHQPTHVVSGKPLDVNLDTEWLYSNLNIYLMDSDIEGSTKRGMDSALIDRISDDYLELNNRIIRQIIEKNSNNLFDQIHLLCARQLSVFSDLFPPVILPFAKEGAINQEYGIKLCGSGGGGFFLLFTRSNELPADLTETGLRIRLLAEI